MEIVQLLNYGSLFPKSTTLYSESSFLDEEQSRSTDVGEIWDAGEASPSNLWIFYPFVGGREQTIVLMW